MGITISGGLNIGSGLTVPASPSDPYFENVTLLLPGNGSNNSTNNTFTDSSTNNFAITRNGNTTQGTFSPFSQTGWSNYFDGTGDYFTVPYSANFNLSSGDWTMEAWFNANSFASAMIIIAKDTYGVNYDWSMLIGSSTSISLYTQRTAVNLTVTVPAMSVGVWYHVAYVRNGSTNTIYLNGVSYGSNTMTISNESLTTPTIGCGSYNNPGGFMNGYISNLRVVKGTAVYTSNFTPPTAPLTAISGTSLLTCQSNRLLDASTNNLTITKYGDVSVQAFSPFNPPLSYTPATVGGSGYFDGTGDYLVTSTNAAFAMSSGDFTVEAWVNVSSTTGYRYIFDFRDGSGAATNIYAYLNSGTMNLNVGVGTTDDSASGSITLGAWAHVALVRSGSTITVYINGVSTNSFSSSQNFSTPTAVTIGRRYTIEQYFIGYISNFRVVKGTAVYTANFTPPTSPVTAISNTSLLLNFTNAGIYDATGKNNLETVGDAKISTVQSKFGGSSMYFDGTGDYLQIPYSTVFDLASSDYTIEFWMNPASSAPATQGRIYSRHQNSVGVFIIIQHTTGAIRHTIQNSAGVNLLLLDTTTAPVANTWTHVAVVRFGNVFTIYLDGTASVSNTAAITIPTITNSPTIGVAAQSFPTLSAFYNGYLQDLRITKGIARYTANFTAPTAPFPTY